MKYYQEVSSCSATVRMEVKLENGVSVVFDDHVRKGMGSDGRTYYPVFCVADDGTPGGSLEPLGWSCDVDREMIISK